MELASMLAGERFSDHPHSVCPTIGSFLRGYNDIIDDDRRQDLYEYAAKVVGTTGPRQLQTRRAERLIEWADEVRGSRSWITRLRRSRARASSDSQSASRYAIRSLRRVDDATHAGVLRLIDELILMGLPEARGAEVQPRTGVGVSA